MLEIIIPTYNRPAMLAKTLRFLDSSNVDCAIHVADGSSPENAARNAKTILRYQKVIEIKHHPYPSEIPMYQRIAFVTKTLDSQYILLHADDDFLFIDAVKECVQFLENNPLYVCCQGPMITCFIDQPVESRLKPYLTNPYSDASAIDRVKRMLYQYSPTFYAVHRRTVLLESFGGGDFNETNPRLDEIASALQTVALGRTGLIDKLYGLRLVHPDQDSQRDTWMDLMMSEKFSLEWTEKLEAVVTCAAKVDGLSVETARSIIRRAFLYFLRIQTRGTVHESNEIKNIRHQHTELVSDAIAGLSQTNQAPALTAALDMI
jgi:glycosyltransferase domain-containing protein